MPRELTLGRQKRRTRTAKKETMHHSSSIRFRTRRVHQKTLEIERNSRSELRKITKQHCNICILHLYCSIYLSHDLSVDALRASHLIEANSTE